MEPYFDAADLHDAIAAKKPHFDWNEDDGFMEIYVYSPYDGHVLLSIPVTQLGYDRVNDLVNSLQQVRQYLQERLVPSVDSEGKVCYNGVYKRNVVGDNGQSLSDGDRRADRAGHRPAQSSSDAERREADCAA